MWMYDKKLEYPIKIKKADPKMAKLIITQYGGPDGELAASLRYLSQRFSMVTPEAKATLNDIGTEELAHLEMVGTMVKQLTQDASLEEIEKGSLAAYYVDHDRAVYPVAASGHPFTAAYIQSKSDPVTDLFENMAAEQKARSTYEYLINMAEDPDVIDPLKFLREREVVHLQRFGEALRIVQEYLENKKRFSIAKGPKLYEAKPGNISPAMGMQPDKNKEPGMSLYPSMSRRPSMSMPDMNVAPSMRSMPDMNVAPSMNRAPDMNAAPSMKKPEMNVAPSMKKPEMNVNPCMKKPEMNVSPSMKKPEMNVAPSMNKAPNINPLGKNK